MPDSHGPFTVVAYIPCKTCNYACVLVHRFDHNPNDDELDRHVFQAVCENCHASQTRVGRDAFKRSIVEWNLEIRNSQPDGAGPL